MVVTQMLLPFFTGCFTDYFENYIRVNCETFVNKPTTTADDLTDFQFQRGSNNHSVLLFYGS